MPADHELAKSLAGLRRLTVAMTALFVGIAVWIAAYSLRLFSDSGAGEKTVLAVLSCTPAPEPYRRYLLLKVADPRFDYVTIDGRFLDDEIFAAVQKSLAPGDTVAASIETNHGPGALDGFRPFVREIEKNGVTIFSAADFAQTRINDGVFGLITAGLLLACAGVFVATFAAYRRRLKAVG